MIRFIFILVIWFGIGYGSNQTDHINQQLEILTARAENFPKLEIASLPGFPDQPLELRTTTPSTYKTITSEFSTLSLRDVEFDLPATVHLLKRTMFGPTVEEITNANTLGLDQTLDLLLNDGTTPLPPGDWVTHPVPENLNNFTDAQIDSLIEAYYYRFQEMRGWWIELILEDGISAREMMVLFWHDHFATSQDKVIFTPAMYNQNVLMRHYAFGNIKEFVKDMALDPAMLLWLDNNQNTVDAINENFARELLELFTIGIGNYTQEDIIEASRAYTGWVTDGMSSFFIPQFHDYGLKTFMGQTGNFNGDDIVDIIFEQDETARFFARKIYRWFLYENPDEAIINELASILRDNDYEIVPLLEALFSSEHFFDHNFRGAGIKSALVHTLGTIRQIYIDEFTPIEEGLSEHAVIIFFQQLFGQVMFIPPDVSGWAGYRTWINTYTLPWRKTFTNAVVDGYVFNFDIGMQMDPIEFVQHFPEPNDAYQLVDDLATYFYAFEPTEQIQDVLLQELLQGLEPYNWSIDIPQADQRIRSLVKLIMRIPDYQLQ